MRWSRCFVFVVVVLIVVAVAVAAGDAVVVVVVVVVDFVDCDDRQMHDDSIYHNTDMSLPMRDIQKHDQVRG